MNDDDRLTPEERKLIEAALRLTESPTMYVGPRHQVLAKAVDAYRKATAPPEPFEARLGIYSDCMNIVTLRQGESFGFADQVWRCTVTPIERIR